MEDFRAKGNEAFKSCKYKEAIDLYTKALAAKPANETAGALYSNRAACWQSLQEYKKACEDAEECIRVRPDWLKGHFRKGTALCSLKQFDDAQRAFKEALKLAPDSDEVKDKLQAVNTELNKRNESAKPSFYHTPEEAKQVGNSLFSAGKYEQAAKFYTRAIELQKEPTKEKANYYANRAACNQQTHLYSAMIEDCNSALAIDPTHVKAYIRRAIAYEGLEKWQLALDDYNKAKSLAPTLPNISQGVLRCQRALRG